MLPRISRSFLLSFSQAARRRQFAASPAQAQTKGGTLIYSTVAGPASLDPYMAGSLIELEVIHEIFETLVAMDENYNARPMLASKVDISNEAKTFTFTLRKGVKFSNGQEMTSADVLASFERFKKVSTNAAAAGRCRQIRDARSLHVHRPSQEHQRRVHRPAEELDLSAGGAAGRARRTSRRARSRSSAPGRSSSANGRRTAISILLRNDELHAGRDAQRMPTALPAGRRSIWIPCATISSRRRMRGSPRCRPRNPTSSAICTVDLAKRLDGNAELSTLQDLPVLPAIFRAARAERPHRQSADPAGDPRGRRCRRHHGRDRHPGAAQPVDAVPAEPVLRRRHGREILRPQGSEEGEGDIEAGRLQRREARAADQLQLSLHARLHPGAVRAAEGGRRQCRRAGDRLDEQFQQPAEGHRQLERHDHQLLLAAAARPAAVEEHCLHLPAHRQGPGDRCGVRQPVQIRRPGGAESRPGSTSRTASSTRPT